MIKKIFPMTFKHLSLSLALFIFFCAIPSRGQENKKPEVLHWELSIGGTSYYVSESNYWNFGPELLVRYAFSNTKSICVSILYPTIMMTSRGYGFREGLAFDLGGWFSTGAKSLLSFGLGLSYIFGSDSDGSQIRAFGPHIGTQASYWFQRKLGLWVRGVLRYWIKDRHTDSQISPSFSAGIGFRF
jgi:uncharacterized protein YneR